MKVTRLPGRIPGALPARQTPSDGEAENRSKVPAGTAVTTEGTPQPAGRQK